MGRLLGVVTGLAWLITCASSPAMAQYSRSVAGWEIAGDSGICLAAGPSGRDEFFGLGLGGDAFFLSLGSSRLRRAGGRSMAATLSIDSRWERPMTGALDDEDIVIFQFDPSDIFVEHFQAGRRLRIDTARGVFKLDLTGSAAVVAAMWECGRQAGALTPPPSDRAGGASGAERAAEFQVGIWNGEAYFNDDGSFETCVVAGPEEGSVLLLFAWSPSGLEIGMQNDGWALATGGRYPVAVAVDGGWRTELEARVIGAESIVIAVGEDRAAIDRLRRGNRLTVSAAQQAFHFDLRGSNAAIGALIDCYAAHTGGGPMARAPDPAGPPAARPPPPAGPIGPVVATGIYRRPMRLGLTDVEELVRSRIAPTATVWLNDMDPPFFEFAGSHGVRDDSRVRGQVMEVHVPSGLIELAMTTLYADRLAECRPGGESGQMPVESYSSLDLQYAVIQCPTDRGNRQVELVLMMTDTDGILYIIEGGYTDTYRMVDLVIAIQTIGRGEYR